VFVDVQPSDRACTVGVSLFLEVFYLQKMEEQSAELRMMQVEQAVLDQRQEQKNHLLVIQDIQKKQGEAQLQASH